MAFVILDNMQWHFLKKVTKLKRYGFFHYLANCQLVSKPPGEKQFLLDIQGIFQTFASNENVQSSQFSQFRSMTGCVLNFNEVSPIPVKGQANSCEYPWKLININFVLSTGRIEKGLLRRTPAEEDEIIRGKICTQGWILLGRWGKHLFLFDCKFHFVI